MCSIICPDTENFHLLSNSDNVFSQQKQRSNNFPDIAVIESDEPIDLTTINNRNDQENFKIAEPAVPKTSLS